MLRVLLTVILLAVLSAPSLGEQIAVYTHSSDDASFIDADGYLRGIEHGGRRAFLVELVREIMLDLGLSPRIENVPLNRGLKLIAGGSSSAFFNVDRIDSRKQLYRWVGPLQEDSINFFENRLKPTRIRSLKDAAKVESICVMRGNSHEQRLQQLGFNNLFQANAYRSCWEMVQLGRVDLMTLGANLEATMYKPGEDEELLVVNTGIPLGHTRGYLAFSLDVPQGTADLWQAALEKIRSSGRYNQLYDAYFWPH